MSKSDRLKLTTTSVRSLTPGEVDQVAGGEGGPPGGNTSLSYAYCGPCPSNNPCATNNCAPPHSTVCGPGEPISKVSCVAENGCVPPWVTKGWCPR